MLSRVFWLVARMLLSGYLSVLGGYRGVSRVFWMGFLDELDGHTLTLPITPSLNLTPPIRFSEVELD